MKLRNLVFLALGIGFAALVALPLRAIKERTYVSDEISLRGGTVKAEIDGTYYPMKFPFWYDGLQTDAPYRLRIFYRPHDSGSHQVALIRVTITGGGVSHPLPVRANLGTWERDPSGNSMYIVGFLDVPVTAPDAVAEVELSLDGTSASAKLSLSRSTTTKVVHSGLEAIMGI